MVEVRLFAYLRDPHGKVVHIDPKEIPTGEALLKHLNIPTERVAIFLVNGFHQSLNILLNDHDVVSLFPPVAGG